MDPDGRLLATGMANAVHVGRVEVECRPLRPGHRSAAQDAVDQLEVVLGKIAAADVDGSGRHVMVVEAGVLLVRPANQPDVDMRVAVQLDVVPAVSVVVDLLLPHLWRNPNRLGERS